MDAVPTPAPVVAVVGGGITGLAAAHALRRAVGGAFRVIVLEATATIGGKLRTEEVGGCLLDTGAESLLARRPEAVELAHEVGLGADLVAPVTTSAHVWSRRSLHPLPARTVLGVPGDLRALASSGLLRPAELARVPLDRWLPRTPVGGDVAVGSFVGGRLGRAVVDRLVEPLLGGVYAGSPDRLSFAATLPALFAAVAGTRSVLAAAETLLPPPGAPAPAVFAGIRGGVGRLPGAVAAASGAQIRTGVTVRSLRRTPTGWVLALGSAAGGTTLDADAVILALPARPAARLLAEVAPAAAAEVGRIDYASVALVTYVFDPATVRGRPAGSGILVPSVERRLVKAATFSSDKWGWVGGEGDRVVIRASVGRHGEERELHHDDAELAQRALADLFDMLDLQASPLDVRVTRWGGALPQYAVGHLSRVERIRAAVVGLPTLAVAGAAYDGVGVPACIASGRAAAARIVEGLRLRRQWEA